MSGELNTEQVKNFSLEPIGAWPDRNKRIHDGVVAEQRNPDADFLAQRDRYQVILLLEPGFHREAVDTGGAA